MGKARVLGKANKRAPQTIRPSVGNKTQNLAARRTTQVTPMMEKRRSNEGGCRSVRNELKQLKEALDVKTKELNEVNLLNSKLLYVNRIFKANQLDDAQK